MMRNIDAALQDIAATESLSDHDPAVLAAHVARRAGARRAVRRGAAGVSSALAIGGIAVAAVATGQSPGPAGVTTEPTGDGEGAGSTAVTFDYRATREEFDPALPLPACGDEAALSATSAHGVSVVLETSTAQTGERELFVRFENAADETRTFLADPAAIVVARDGVVVSDPRMVLGQMQAFHVEAGGVEIPRELGPQLGGTLLCGFLEELATVTNEAGSRDGAAIGDIIDQWQELPPGDYTVWAVTPVMFGEMAGAGQVFVDEGLRDLGELGALEGTCISIDAQGNQTECEPADLPPGIGAENTTVLVPNNYIDDLETTFTVSEPVYFTIE